MNPRFSDCAFIFEGVAGTSSFEGIGFYRSKHQPKDDPRPYMQAGLCTLLSGNDPRSYPAVKAAFNYKQEVFTNVF